MVSNKTSSKKNDILKFLSSIFILCSIWLASYFLYFKLDLTEDKRYTLQPETVKFLEEMDDVAQFKIYLEGDELPAGFVKLKNSIKEMLLEFSEHSGESIEFEFVNLYEIESKDKREREIMRLAQLGIPYMPVEQKKEDGAMNSFFVTPGAEVFYKGKTIGINLLVNQHQDYQENFKKSIEELEYQLSNALRKLSKQKAQNVGFLQLHGESNQFELQDLAQTLSEYYTIGPVFLVNEKNEIDYKALNLLDVLVISGPIAPFHQEELLVLDQFVMKGGKVLCLLDGIHADLDSLRTSPYFPAMPLNTNLENLFFSYGLRINNDLVEDAQCVNIPIQTGPAGSTSKPEMYPWVYFPLVFSENSHLINKNLDPVKMEFASTLDSIAVPGVKHHSILNTSGKNRYRKTPLRIGFEDAILGQQVNLLKEGKKSVAMLLEGKFTSYFSNRILPDNFKEKFNKTSPETKILVISSGTFANNIVLPEDKTLPLGADRYSADFYDNKRFLLNAVNYLSGDSALIPVRSKKIEMRLLNKNKVRDEKTTIQWLNLILPPALILLVASIFFIWRKRKYGK